MLESLELGHPDSHHGVVIGQGDALRLSVVGVQDAEGDPDLIRPLIDEVASPFPGGNLLIVERSVLSKVKEAVAIGVSSLEVSGSLGHHLLHSFGVLIERGQEVLVDLLFLLGGGDLPVLEGVANLGVEASIELSGKGGLFFCHRVILLCWLVVNELL